MAELFHHRFVDESMNDKNPFSTCHVLVKTDEGIKEGTSYDERGEKAPEQLAAEAVFLAVLGEVPPSLHIREGVEGVMVLIPGSYGVCPGRRSQLKNVCKAALASLASRF